MPILVVRAGIGPCLDDIVVDNAAVLLNNLAHLSFDIRFLVTFRSDTKDRFDFGRLMPPTAP
jgi:hypothetical protein